MKDKQTLSDKIDYNHGIKLDVDDVREAVNELIKETNKCECGCCDNMEGLINEKFGEKLTGAESK